MEHPTSCCSPDGCGKTTTQKYPTVSKCRIFTSDNLCFISQLLAVFRRHYHRSSNQMNGHVAAALVIIRKIMFSCRINLAFVDKRVSCVLCSCLTSFRVSAGKMRKFMRNSHCENVFGRKLVSKVWTFSFTKAFPLCRHLSEGCGDIFPPSRFVTWPVIIGGYEQP